MSWQPLKASAWWLSPIPSAGRRRGRTGLGARRRTRGRHRAGRRRREGHGDGSQRRLQPGQEDSAVLTALPNVLRTRVPSRSRHHRLIQRSRALSPVDTLNRFLSAFESSPGFKSAIRKYFTADCVYENVGLTQAAGVEDSIAVPQGFIDQTGFDHMKRQMLASAIASAGDTVMTGRIDDLMFPGEQAGQPQADERVRGAGRQDLGLAQLLHTTTSIALHWCQSRPVGSRSTAAR